MKNLLAITAVMATFAIGGCSDADGVPEGDPATKVGSEREGRGVPPGILVGQDEAVYWVQRALAGFHETTEDELPGQIVVTAPMEGCTFRKPESGEAVANVHIGAATMQTPIYAFSGAELARSAESWINSYKTIGTGPDSSAVQSRGYLRTVDVVVTETAKPVYLVLQSESGRTLWNVHAAPGAKIAHVAALGSSSVAVANVDEAAPVEFMNGAKLKRCRIAPARQPADHWIAVRRAKDFNTEATLGELDRMRERHRAYSRWFASNFGQASEQDVVGMASASHVLVGPLPQTAEQRVPFRSLEGAFVQLAQEDHVVATGFRDYRSKYDALVVDLVKQMVGGDLAALRPNS